MAGEYQRFPKMVPNLASGAESVLSQEPLWENPQSMMRILDCVGICGEELQA